MAEQVKEIPKATRYPWDDWLKLNSKWKLIQGKDFDLELKSMATSIHNASRRRGYRVTVRMNSKDKTLYLETSLPPEKDKAPKKAKPTPKKKKVTKKDG